LVLFEKEILRKERGRGYEGVKSEKQGDLLVEIRGRRKRRKNVKGRFCSNSLLEDMSYSF